jgi:hypothetical protein
MRPQRRRRLEKGRLASRPMPLRMQTCREKKALMVDT